jgi:type IV fimbrial biogenesis protein FimT
MVLNHEYQKSQRFNSRRIIDCFCRYGNSDDHCHSQLPDLRGAARMVMSDLMAARMKAVSLNQRVKVSFGGDEYQIWNDTNCDGTVADHEGENIGKQIPSEYYDVTLSRSADPIFHPRGTVALEGTITLTNSRGSKYVIVSSTGRVRISDTPS